MFCPEIIAYVTVSGTFGIGGILGSVEDGASVFIENCSNHGSSSFRGQPIVLVTAGLMAIAFCGFAGVI